MGGDMNLSTKKLLARATAVVVFLSALYGFRAYKQWHKPVPTPVPMDTNEVKGLNGQEEFRKKLAELDARRAASHAARVKRLGEAGAKAQESRCDEEWMKAFKYAMENGTTPSETSDCDN
jgi:hypothetical protein